MPDEYVTGFFLSAQLVVETVEESVRVGYFDTFSTCMDPGFFLTSNFAEEYSRAAAPLWSVLLNEPLLTVAISPVRSAACTSTSLRVLAAVDRSTELKCCGRFVPRCK